LHLHDVGLIYYNVEASQSEVSEIESDNYSNEFKPKFYPLPAGVAWTLMLLGAIVGFYLWTQTYRKRSSNITFVLVIASLLCAEG